jgi:hypothetical protein
MLFHRAIADENRDYNCAVKKYNSSLTESDELAVLHDVYQNQSIPDFPATRQDLDELERKSGRCPFPYISMQFLHLLTWPDDEVIAILAWLGHEAMGAEHQDRLALSILVCEVTCN